MDCELAHMFAALGTLSWPRQKEAAEKLERAGVSSVRIGGPLFKRGGKHERERRNPATWIREAF